jgi:heme exporter protein D
MALMTALLGPHAGFIVAAYAVTVLTIGGLAGWIVLDRRALRQRLDELERRGIRRRSAGREQGR